ncbi:sterol desaturase family protein [Rhodoferax sp.]|uniref:sterol desaturase family protein n=1 Tax=Rhodoferax sp. TaxID=50421 RepID=UPI00261774CF|nr:sterol desaturase family protein [Rhodoferax sp.]MDD2809212.1 sterol desaturase family protein [Rhodoferax sp.]
MQWLADVFADGQGSLFERVLQPLMFQLGLGNLLPDGYNATGWLLVGLLQLVVLLGVIGPLERWRPVQPVTDFKAVWVDVLYTLIHRLGVFRLALFFTLDPLFDAGFGALRVAGWETFQLDAVWPGVTDVAWVSLLLYLVVLDFVNYWVHRAEHQWHWWWQLHALHHAQTQVTMWSDNRNHLLDDVLRAMIFVVVAQAIGIAPGQFVAIVAFTQLSESFQHANVRLWFGRVGERLWISPRFHRLHHAAGIGHESGAPQTLGGHNFGVLLPWWDMWFGTANFEVRFDPTGVRDQLEQGRDYGRGFWSQQRLGVLRLLGRA